MRIGWVFYGLFLFGLYFFKFEYVFLFFVVYILYWFVDFLKYQYVYGWNVFLKVYKGSVYYCVDNSDIFLGICFYVIGGECGFIISFSILWWQYCYVLIVMLVFIIIKVYRVVFYELIRRGEDYGNQ